MFETLYRKNKFLLLTQLSIVLLIFVLFCYYDSCSLTIWSTNILDLIWEGRLNEFYQYTINNFHSIHHTYIGGQFLNLFPLAIWNIPIWILQYFYHIEIVDSIPCMIWSRMFLILVLILTCKYIKKICDLLNYGELQKEIILLLCTTGSIIDVCLCYSGQNDILWICFSVIAVYFYIKNEKFKFYLFTNISILLKPFFAPMALFLIILKEKRIAKIIFKFISLFFLFLIANIICYFMPGYKECVYQSDTMSTFSFYTSKSFNFPLGYDVPYIIIVIIALGIYCYCYNLEKKDKKSIHDFTINILSLYTLLWFIFSKENYYRFIAVIPWIYVSCFKNNRVLPSLFGVTFYEISLFFVLAFNDGNFLNIEQSLKPSLLSNFNTCGGGGLKAY